MNQTASAPGATLTPSWTDTFTAGHLIFVALLMLLAIAVIIAGIIRARRRRQTRAELEAHNHEIAIHTSDHPDLPPPSPAPGSRAPVQPDAAHAAPRVMAPPAPVAAPARPHLTIVPSAPEPIAPQPSASEPIGASPADGPVTQLKGLGPKVATRLAELGITTVGHLAALTDDEAATLDTQMGPFAGRMGRDRWQEQARFLAMGDVKGFEAVFGRL